MQYLGLDIGGTKIAAALFSEDGQQLFYQRFETIKSDYHSFLQHVVAIIEQTARHASDTYQIGIGLPGAICPGTQRIKNANILAINDQPLQSDLEQWLKQPVYLGNDADCFTLSEALFGAGKQYHSCFGVIIGTGCGGGLVYEQKLVRGPNNVAGEWGHNPLAHYSPDIDGKTEPCYCGRSACNELFLSGTGFARGYNARYASQMNSVDIMQARPHCANAQAHYALYVDQLARALSQVINLFDPAAIVLGGGMSNVAELYQDVPKQLPQYVFGGYCATPILPAQLGDDSGVKGAAFLGR
ncbi:ROK family protein [Vibrio proteolyticus]|uniref:Fructokinase n=1 Tax=Vibrio proteolyticus NBRC 13287 TaxID=1219065 RepID=U3A3U0_VIBPR|nr:ROK family protein [Vibrio proteolyticus]GAD68017.1 fructokinase [Vibrio proteolyticus NBRC 13287]